MMGHSTHIKDIKDPVEVQFPSGNRLFVILCVEKSRGYISPALFDDLPLDLCHGSVLEMFSGRFGALITDSTHIDNWFIASHTD